MTYKLLAAATLSLGLGTAVAMAQTTTTQPEAGAAPAESQMPMGWEGPIGDAFFADPEMGSLRTEEEVRANWQTLTDEQQAQVRAHCDTVDTAATGTLDDTTTGTRTEDEVTTGSTTPDATTHMASIEQVCGWIDTM